ncbi:unnamed protein product [Discula destructiva]
MSHAHAVLAPTSSLPRLRSADLDDLTEDQIASALRNLTHIYCPLSHAAAVNKPSLPTTQAKCLSLPFSSCSGTSTPLPIDSGYASGNDGDEDDSDGCTHPDEHDHDHAAALRADEYERQFAIRWLTTFLARVEELLLDIDDESRQCFIDEASYILASFSSTTDAEEEDDGGAIVREFRFSVNAQEEQPLEVRLTDGTPATGTDHTDVGLQSWGASIVVSDLMCAAPETFGLFSKNLGTAPRIVELGAGTGLVGITLAKLLPRLGVPAAHIVATDYHPAVLENLRENIAANFPTTADDPPVKTCLLDWAAPCLAPPLLYEPADMLVATDVVYAPEHAVWLRDCAARMLAKPDGVFWLVTSVRPNGRFEGVTDTVEAAFAHVVVDDDDDGDACPTSTTTSTTTTAATKGEDGRLGLRILQKEMVEKRRGVGRGDEVGYKVFRIGWSEVEGDSLL